MLEEECRVGKQSIIYLMFIYIYVQGSFSVSKIYYGMCRRIFIILINFSETVNTNTIFHQKCDDNYFFICPLFFKIISINQF